MEDEQAVEPRLPQGEIHRVLRLAAIAHGLPDAVLVTGHALLRYVPRDAEHPISPARVQDLADERGCDQGIDFSPMLAAADALAIAALKAEAVLDERRQLAARVSELKRQLRNSIAAQEEDSGAAARVAAVLDACPKRHRALSLRELAALAARLEVATKLLADAEDPADGRIFSSDRGDATVQPYTTEKDENPVCKAAPPAASGDGAADALRHITLDMLAAALPFDWRICIENSGPLSWANLVATAYGRAAEIGVTDAIWAEAQGELGRAGAAVLVLLADADSVERRGTIRCPAAWVRAMAARAETEPLRLRRNLFGLLHRRRGGAAPCPVPGRTPVPQPTTRSPCHAS